MLKRTGKLKTNKPLKRSTIKAKARSNIRRVGKKTSEWSKARKEVLEYFESIGLPQTCELVLNDRCLRTQFLSLAHAKKRRKIDSEHELKNLVVACQVCHDFIENLPAEEMQNVVETAIKNRGK